MNKQIKRLKKKEELKRLEFERKVLTEAQKEGIAIIKSKKTLGDYFSEILIIELTVIALPLIVLFLQRTRGGRERSYGLIRNSTHDTRPIAER